MRFSDYFCYDSVAVKSLLKVHYTASRKAAYLDFANSPGKVGHPESALLIEDVYKEISVKETEAGRPFLGYLETFFCRSINKPRF